MLLYATVALTILSSVLLLHYLQHYRLKLCIWVRPSISIMSSSSISNTRRSPHRMYGNRHLKRKCICKLVPTDADKFNYFPMSFLLYIIFMIFLCILVIIMDILQNYQSYKAIPSALYTLSFQSYHDNYFNKIGRIHFGHQYDINNIFVVFDYILIYGTMILSLWESLFSFYRYYTTYKTAVTLQLVSTVTVIKKFVIYAVIFCTIYICQIHVYYWLYPLIILLHLLFNLYCTLTFTSLLIGKLNEFSEISNHMDIIENPNNDLIENVYFMKRISIICCILQTLYLGLFVITYNVHTIYYLPIFWSISSGIFSFNFIRNRHFIQTLVTSSKCHVPRKTDDCSSMLHRIEVNIDQQDNHQSDGSNIESPLTLQSDNSERNNQFKLNDDDDNELKEHKQSPVQLTPISHSNDEIYSKHNELSLKNIANSAPFTKIGLILSAKRNNSNSSCSNSDIEPMVIRPSSASNPLLIQQCKAQQLKSISSAPIKQTNDLHETERFSAFFSKFNAEKSEFVYNSDIDQEEEDVNNDCDDDDDDNDDAYDIDEIYKIYEDVVVEGLVNVEDSMNDIFTAEYKSDNVDNNNIDNNNNNTMNELNARYIDEIMASFNALEAYGFCSQKDVTTLRQFIKYCPVVRKSHDYGTTVPFGKSATDRSAVSGKSKNTSRKVIKSRSENTNTSTEFVKTISFKFLKF